MYSVVHTPMVMREKHFNRILHIKLYFTLALRISQLVFLGKARIQWQRRPEMKWLAELLVDRYAV